MREQTHIAEIIEKYRAYCLFYVKLDLAGIGAIATVATILKLNLWDVAFFSLQIGFLLSVNVALLVAGLVFDRYFLDSWCRELLHPREDAKIVQLFAHLTRIQMFLHITFLALLLAGIVGFLESTSEHFKQ